MQLLAAALVLTALATPVVAQVAPAPIILTSPEARDVWTYAQPRIARVTHVDVDLTADFAAKVMRGTATLDVLAMPGAKEIVLDTYDLAIAAITDADGKPLPYAIGAHDPNLGAPLTIQLAGASRLVIRYASKPGARALQWLAPELTAGKARPYLFSQGEAINNRSWIPTQDSPGIRQTWSATITVPGDLVAVMSGERIDGTKGNAAPNGLRSFRFRMEKPVPIYLLALAIGDLAFKATGPRSGVWTEPSMLEAAANEVGDVEQLIDAAEALYGPYRWGRYDMLVLPPSFPFGGMENPTLTFLTPTIITGDRSNVDVVAHELAHSWSGNLVTNATWSDSWLNEGVTTYFENRIMEAVYGPERAAIYADTEWETLQSDLRAAGGMKAPATRLHGDPGATFGRLDYSKGSTFLRTIERAVGRPRFDAYLRSYFDRHAFQPQTTAGFLADLRANLINGDPALEAQLQLDRWVYGPGLPDNAVQPFVEAMVSEMVSGEIKPDQCTAIERGVRILSPLPPENTAELVTFILVMTDKPKPGKTSAFPICKPAA